MQKHIKLIEESYTQKHSLKGETKMTEVESSFDNLNEQNNLDKRNSFGPKQIVENSEDLQFRN